MNDSNRDTSSIFFTYATYLLGVRKKWFIRTLFIALVAVLISFLIPPKFRSRASIISQDSDNNLSLLGNFSDLASLAGINVGSVSSVDLYPAIISSDTVLIEVLNQRFHVAGSDSATSLFDILGIQDDNVLKRNEDGLKFFRDNLLEVSSDKRSGIVSIVIETKYPDLSSAVVNSVVQRLDEYMRLKRRTTASEQRSFIELRLKQVDRDLFDAEDSLRMFREKNRNRGSSPQLQTEEARFSRRVDVALGVFVELKKQYEVVKIQEIRNTSIVQVLDQGRIPGRKSWPKRTLIVLMTTFLGALVTGVHLLLSRTLKEEGDSKNAISFLRDAFGEIRNDMVQFFRFSRAKT